MKVSESNSTIERSILIGQLTDDLIASRVAEQWPEEGGLYAAKYANLLGGWAVKHLRKYGRAPREHVEPLYEAWSTRAKDVDTVEMVGTLLGSLSGDWGNTQGQATDWILDQAQIYFTHVRGKKHIERLQKAWDGGSIDEYNEVANGWAPPSVSSAQWVDLLRDEAGLDAAYAAQEKALFTFPGPLGMWLGNTFERDAFVVFTGIAKSGKSFVLMDVAARAMEAGLRVAYFSIGDMSEKQVKRRWGSRLTGLPRRMPESGIIQMPVGWDDESEMHAPVFEPRKFRSVATADLAKMASRMMLSQLGAIAKEDVRLRLSVHPAGSVDIFQIEALLRSWQIQGWVPDCIVLDYADLIRPPAKSRDERDGINTTWIHLRGISQVYHCCLVTATQADTKGYDAPRLTMSNFSGDRRKNDHVTCNIGLSTSPKEEKLGIVRWGQIRARDEPQAHEVAVLGCRAISQPVMFTKLIVPQGDDDDSKASKPRGRRAVRGDVDIEERGQAAGVKAKKALHEST